MPAEAAGLRRLKVLETEVVLSLSLTESSDVLSLRSFAVGGGRRAGLAWQFVQRNVVWSGGGWTRLRPSRAFDIRLWIVSKRTRCGKARQRCSLKW